MRVVPYFKDPKVQGEWLIVFVRHFLFPIFPHARCLADASILKYCILSGAYHSKENSCGLEKDHFTCMHSRHSAQEYGLQLYF